MTKGFWKYLISSESLIEDAKLECIHMLDTGREMFLIVTRALKEQLHRGEIKKISRMDKSLNQEVREVRKKVFQHLVVSRGKDLLAGLQMTSIVIDLERIGDYTKNIGELVEMMPSRWNFGSYEPTYASLHKKTLRMFELVTAAYTKDDEEKARESLGIYDTVSKTCDGIVREIFRGKDSGDTIEKRYLALALLLRYMKRVNAHLKNIATSIINPFHMIGFRPGAV